VKIRKRHVKNAILEFRRDFDREKSGININIPAIDPIVFRNTAISFIGSKKMNGDKAL
jgi:hypothetical protein